MKRIFELNLPPKESQKEFLMYFNSELRAIQQSGTGTASFGTDGSYTAYSNSRIKIGQEICSLSFSIHTDVSGLLTHIEVEQIEDTTIDWEKTVDFLVRTALAKALSSQKTQYFYRTQLRYFGAAMDGEYWINNFRLAPSQPDDPSPHLMDAERIMYLDFHVNAVDINQAMVLAQDFASLQAARFALLVNISIFSKTEQNMRWVMPPPSSENPNPESVLWYTIFNPKNPLPHRMPDKGEFCKLSKFSGSVADIYRLCAGDLITLPEETRKIFRLLQSNVQFGYAFDACARLYQLSLIISRHSISASLAYRVAAIEAICQSMGSINSPSEFIRKYSPDRVSEEFLDFLYGKVRSGHFHAGSMPLDKNDSVPFHPFFSADYLLQSHLTREGFFITRKAIAHWILEEIRKVEPQS